MIVHVHWQNTQQVRLQVALIVCSYVVYRE
jgi:hypothetical protein